MHSMARSSDESGIALVVTVLLLLLVSAIGISALNRAGEEKIISTVSRRQVSNLSAAEAGMRLVQAQLSSSVGGVPIDAALDQPTMFRDASGLPTAVRSGSIGATSAQKITPLGGAKASDRELRIGGGGAPSRLAYRVDVTATDPTGGAVQIQAQFSVRSTVTAGY